MLAPQPKSRRMLHKEPKGRALRAQAAAAPSGMATRREMYLPDNSDLVVLSNVAANAVLAGNPQAAMKVLTASAKD